jgi:undecaprenyl-diphosphatase
MDLLHELDTSLFYFINVTLANPVTDKLMPFITSTSSWLIFYIIMALYLIAKGGSKGRVSVLLTALLLCLTVSSYEMLKDITARARPCELPGVNLLIPCPENDSMPSGHAVDTFASAALFTFFYPLYRYLFYSAAFLISLSRIFCGVHYPSDVFAGAVYGTLCGLGVIWAWRGVSKKLTSYNNF